MEASNYIEYNFTIKPVQPATEILIAELGYLGFESFVETETGVTAYIQEKDWSESILEDVHILKSSEFTITYTQETVEQTNWNSEWEKNFNPIEVDGKVSIRAPFHKNPNLLYDIVIEPKMSFGTGHHETTYMMIQHLLEMDLTNKSVLDMGCGTGILAIFAEMRGAKPIDAIDIDNWCYVNSLENIERNKMQHISVYEGDVALLNNKKYDVIIANINRNILLQDMDAYMNSLHKDGIILFSGFYKEDIPLIDKAVMKYGLARQKTIERNQWVALKYSK